jgi:hypothetical protein
MPAVSSPRGVVVEKMSDIIKAHACMLYVIMLAKSVVLSNKHATLLAAFCACVNVVCASERIWSVQAENLFIWGKATQIVFFWSKIVCRASAVLMLGLWVVVFKTVFGTYQ